jgi:acetolactate synthase-1/3 small subunit
MPMSPNPSGNDAGSTGMNGHTDMVDRKLTPQQILRRKAAGEPLHPDEIPERHRRIISVLLNNSIGALIRVANMFSQRGFNLESVAVGETEDPSISRMTVVTLGNRRQVGQVIRQLNNLVDTLHVVDLTDEEFVERELCLIKVRYTPESRPEIIDYVKIFKGKVIDITHATMTFEITGPTKKINAFVEMMRPHGIEEVMRSGRIALRRALVHGG